MELIRRNRQSFSRFCRIAWRSCVAPSNVRCSARHGRIHLSHGKPFHDQIPIFPAGRRKATSGAGSMSARSADARGAKRAKDATTPSRPSPRPCASTLSHSCMICAIGSACRGRRCHPSSTSSTRPPRSRLRPARPQFSRCYVSINNWRATSPAYLLCVAVGPEGASSKSIHAHKDSIPSCIDQCGDQFNCNPVSIISQAA